MTFVALMCSPALAQTKQDPAASPGTSVNETQLPKNQLPSANTDMNSTQAPNTGTGSRALTPGAQNPDGTPRAQSPGQAPQLPGMKEGK